NRVLAADTRIVFGRLYFVEAQLGGSWTREGAGPVRSAPIWQLAFDRTGRSFGFNYQVSGLGEDFVARSGFVPRTGIMNAHAFNRLSWYGAEGALLETGSVLLQFNRLWRHGRFGDGAIEGDESADLILRFRGGWSAGVEVAREFVELHPADYTGYETQTTTGLAPYSPLDRVSGPALRGERVRRARPPGDLPRGLGGNRARRRRLTRAAASAVGARRGECAARADHARARRLRVRAHADPAAQGRDPADARVLLPRGRRAPRGAAGRAHGRAHRRAAVRGWCARGPRGARRAARGPARVLRARARHGRVHRLRQLAGAQPAAWAGGAGAHERRLLHEAGVPVPAVRRVRSGARFAGARIARGWRRAYPEPRPARVA